MASGTHQPSLSYMRGTLVDSLIHHGEVGWKNRTYLKDHSRGRADPGQPSSISGLVQVREHQGAHGHGTSPSAAVNKHLLVQFQKRTRSFMMPSASLTYLASQCFRIHPIRIDGLRTDNNQ